MDGPQGAGGHLDCPGLRQCAVQPDTVPGFQKMCRVRGGDRENGVLASSRPYFSPPAYPGEARVAGGPVLPEERPRMTPPLLQCDPCVSEKNKGK